MSSEYLPTTRCSFCLLLVPVLYVCLTAGLPEDEAKRSNPVYSFLRSQRLRPKEMFGVSTCIVIQFFFFFYVCKKKTLTLEFRAIIVFGSFEINLHLALFFFFCFFLLRMCA